MALASHQRLRSRSANKLSIRKQDAARRARREMLAGYKPRLEALEDRRLMAGDLRPAGVDVILEWNAVMLGANAADHARTSPEQGGPVLTGRAFAIVSTAMYDAYNSIEKIGEAYLVKAPRSLGADSDAAVAQAARDTLVALYPNQKAKFDAALAQTLKRIRSGT